MLHFWERGESLDIYLWHVGAAESQSAKPLKASMRKVCIPESLDYFVYIFNRSAALRYLILDPT